MKRFSIFILMILAYHVNGQNVGINNTDPQTTLDVNGKFRIRSTGFAVSSGINVLTNSGTSYYSLNGNPGADFEVILPAGVKGTFLIVENATDGGFTASVSGFGTIPPGKSKLLLFGDTGWVLAHESEESQLEKITEGGNTGWRLLTENPDYHGNIGQKAMDLSISPLGVNSIYGATGDYAVALGRNVISEGESAIAIGRDVRANGFAATSLGSGNEVNGDYSTALGNDNVINTSHGAAAIGSINELNNANNSTALGSANIVNANAASAIGESNTVSGIAATAIGSGNITEGDYAASIGFANAAIGNNSLAIGNSNGAWNENAIAMGNESEALGVTTTAMGSSLASSLLSVSMGRYSDTIVGSNRSTWVDTDPLLALGNGSNITNLKNAMTVYKNGTLQLENHTTTPANSTNKFYVQNNEPYFGTQKLQASQLEKITEGGNTGWRLLGYDPIFYGNIGNNSVDLSYSLDPSSQKGAINIRSFATGYETTAGGPSSTAMGFLSIALGDRSIAIGNQTTALGASSSAMGNNTFAIGESSTAIGYNTQALGNYGAVSMGHFSKAAGDISLAMGDNVVSKAYESVAFGRFNDSIATSNAINWVDSDPLFIIGNGTDHYNRKNAMTVYKNGTLQLENHTATPAHSSDKFYVQNNEPYFGTQKLQASQLEKITEGGNTGWRLAGRDNNNYGNIGIDAVDFSISVGPSSTAGATGERSFAIGSTTTASGNKSTAMGWLTKATGDASTAMGFGAYASPYASVALGRYNDTIVGSSRTLWVNTDPLLIVGNGIDNNNRSNALTVYKNANTEISGYTRLGLASEGAPFIKTKKFTGNTSSTYNGDLQISHSPIPASKILSVSVFVEWTTNQFVPPAFASSPDLVYNYYLDSANIVIRNNTPDGNCTICDKPVKVLITYEE